jgi:exonuclease VII small subunit
MEEGAASTKEMDTVTASWKAFDEGYALLTEQVRRLEQEPLSLYERRELLLQAQGQNRQCASILETASRVLREKVFEAPPRAINKTIPGTEDPFQTVTGLPEELRGHVAPLEPEEETCLQHYEKNLQELEESVQTLEEMTQGASSSEPCPLSAIMTKATQVARLSYETSRAEKLIMT